MLNDRFEMDLRQIQVNSEWQRREIVKTIVDFIDKELNNTLPEQLPSVLLVCLEEAKMIGDWETRNSIIDYVVEKMKPFKGVIEEAKRQKEAKCEEILSKKINEVFGPEIRFLQQNYLLPHLGVLLRKRKELVLLYEDDYGQKFVIDEAWHSEIDYFMATVVDSTEFKKLFGPRMHREIYNFVERSFQASNQISLPPLQNSFWNNDAIEFENACANEIKKQGWEVKLTKKTGDQGADIICKKDSISVVCQVKMFASKVGNKAVQEVLGAKEYYNGDLGVVIAKVGFTNSAIRLAASSNVILFKFVELNKFSKRVFANI